MVWWFAIPAIIGGLVAWGVFLDKKQQERLNGKKITILGARESGKSRFFEFIATNQFAHDTSHYEQTRKRVTIKDKYHVDKMEKNISGITVKFDLANSYDIGGGQNSYGDWEKVAKNANFLLYLIDSDRLFHSPQYHETIKKDIAAIEEIVRKRNSNDEDNKHNQFDGLMIVANQMDKLSGNHDWESRIINHPIIQASRLKLGGTNYCKLVMGSLKNEQSAEALLKNVLETL